MVALWGHSGIYNTSMKTQIQTHYKISALIWWNLIFIISMSLVGCEEIRDRFGHKSQHRIELYDDAIYITIPWYEPVSYSAVVYPRNFKIDEVIKETFVSLKNVQKDRNIGIFIILYQNVSDKYGKNYIESSLYKIMDIDTKEAKKYRNYRFFESSYELEDKIRILHNCKPLKIITQQIN